MVERQAFFWYYLCAYTYGYWHPWGIKLIYLPNLLQYVALFTAHNSYNRQEFSLHEKEYFLESSTFQLLVSEAWLFYFFGNTYRLKQVNIEHRCRTYCCFILRHDVDSHRTWNNFLLNVRAWPKVMPVYSDMGDSCPNGDIDDYFLVKRSVTKHPLSMDTLVSRNDTDSFDHSATHCWMVWVDFI